MEIGEKKMPTLNEKTVSKVVCNVQKELSNDTERSLVECQESQCADLQFLSADSFSSALLVVSSKEGGRGRTF